MKGEIGSFSFDVAKRILDRLDEGDANRTNLATHTGLNYRNLVRYINMLNSVGWTTVSGDGLVAITQLGRETRKKLVQLNLGDSESPGAEHLQIRQLAKEHGLASSLGTGRSTQSLATATTTATATAIGNAPAQKTARTRSKMKNVLIVDDEPDVALTYDMFLKSTGRYNVRVFTESPSALQDFVSRSKYYDLVILDVRMPDINGLQMYQSIASVNPDCKFLIVTSLDAVDELVSLFPKIQTSEIIRKPIGKANFVRIVDRLLFDN